MYHLIYNRLTQQVNQTSSTLDHQKSQLLEREKEVEEVTKEIQKLKEDTDPINNIHSIRKQIVNNQPTTTGKEIANSTSLVYNNVCVCNYIVICNKTKLNLYTYTNHM